MTARLRTFTLPGNAGVVHADASGALLVIASAPRQRYAIRTVEELERARSALFQALEGRGELRAVAVNVLVSAWEHHVNEYAQRMERNAEIAHELRPSATDSATAS